MPETTDLNTSVPHSARLWNYWLGGADNFEVDRLAGDEIARRLPSITALAREDRAFLGRMVHHLVADRGIRQILDIGSGLPTADNTHEVAQRAAPNTRIVYVDNEPLELVHARQLLAGSPEGRIDYVQADLNDPATILRRAAGTLDLDRPVALTLLGIVHFILDDDAARSVVRDLVDAVPSGSYLAIAHGCRDINTAQADDIVAFWNEHGTPKIKYRDAADIAGFFDGLDLLDPGVVPCNRWRPGPGATTEDVNQYCAVARKP